VDLLSVVPNEELMMLVGDLNGHVGAISDGYEGVHGGFGYGQRNEEEKMILEIADALELVICNTRFKKETTKLVTYAVGDVKTTLDYILTRQKDKGMIRNATVIASEECVAGHKLVITDVTVGVLKKRKAVKCVPKLRVWKLKKQPFRDAYANEVKLKASEIKKLKE